MPLRMPNLAKKIFLSFGEEIQHTQAGEPSFLVVTHTVTSQLVLRECTNRTGNTPSQLLGELRFNRD